MDIGRIEKAPALPDPIQTNDGDSTAHPSLQTHAEAPHTPSPNEESSSKTKTDTPPDLSGMEKLVAEVNKKLQAENHQARFEVDKKTDKVVFRLIDSESGEVLRQLPPEDMLRMAEQMRKESNPHFIKTTA